MSPEPGRFSAEADADLLLLMDQAHEHVDTLEIVYDEWEARRASNQVRFDRSARGTLQARWVGGGPQPHKSATTRRIWFQSPNRLRVEIHGASRLLRLGVRQGPAWSRWDFVEGTSRGAERPDVPGSPIPPFLAPALLTPTRLLSHLRLRPSGEGVRAGRPVRHATGRLRSVDRSVPATTFEFEFDAEHGTVLRRATIEEGEQVELTVATEVAYNRRIEPKHFVFDPPTH